MASKSTTTLPTLTDEQKHKLVDALISGKLIPWAITGLLAFVFGTARLNQSAESIEVEQRSNEIMQSMIEENQKSRELFEEGLRELRAYREVFNANR